MRITSDHLAHFHNRVLLDAFHDASRTYWEQRARAFEAAMPRPGDYTGQATPQQLVEQAIRCKATANACRNRAAVLEHTEADFTATVHDITGAAA